MHIKTRRCHYLLLLGWPKHKTPTPTAGEGVEQQELSSLDGKYNGVVTLEDSLAVF